MMMLNKFFGGLLYFLMNTYSDACTQPVRFREAVQMREVRHLRAQSVALRWDSRLRWRIWWAPDLWTGMTKSHLVALYDLMNYSRNEVSHNIFIYFIDIPTTSILYYNNTALLDRDWCWWWYLMEHFTQHLKKMGITWSCSTKIKKKTSY